MAWRDLDQPSVQSPVGSVIQILAVVFHAYKGQKEYFRIDGAQIDIKE
jgi:hypothetical protein